jgi:uncharacterized protein involved in outer membrane biogenesis
MKKLLWTLVAVVAVAGAVVAIGYFNLDAIVKAAVEEFGSEATRTKVTLDAASIRPAAGAGSLRGLDIGNPEGYRGKLSFHLGEISLTLDTASLTSDVIVVKEVLVDAPKVYAEVDASGGMNLRKIQSNVEAYGRSAGGGGGDGARRGGGGRGKAKAAEHRYIIDELTIRGGRVELVANLDEERKAGADIPEVRLRGLGRAKGGATAEEITAEVLEALTRSAVDAAMRDGIENAAKGLLDKAKDALGDKLGGLLGDEPADKPGGRKKKR